MRVAFLLLMFVWQRVPHGEHRWLSSIEKFFDPDTLEFIIEEGATFSRLHFDGVSTVRGKVNGRWTGLVSTDFRVLGGTFSKKNTARVTRFLKWSLELEIPVVMSLDSAGVRFTQGRTIFSQAFQIIPLLNRLRKQNLLITLSLDHCIGLASLFFAEGNYRIALSEGSLINLTGSEVHSLFFGKNAGYEKFSAADSQILENTLVHELVSTLDDALARAKTLLSAKFEDLEKLPVSEKADRAVDFVNTFADGAVEVFPQLAGVVRCFVVEIGTRKFGAFLNPPGNPNNMLTVRAVDKCQAALEFFRAMRLPIVSFLDCPGGDPRQKESDRDAIRKMITFVNDAIDYAFPKMGVVLGRSYGGSGMFALPKIFGSERTIVVRGANVGVIHESIVQTLIESAPRMREEWAAVAPTQTADFQDMIASGDFDRMVELTDLGGEISDFLDRTGRRPEMRVGRRITLSPADFVERRRAHA
jgi:acetyl-CoA carboxylase carboxyltransferase component